SLRALERRLAQAHQHQRSNRRRRRTCRDAGHIRARAHGYRRARQDSRTLRGNRREARMPGSSEGLRRAPLARDLQRIGGAQRLMFLLVAFLIFTGALLAAAYYVWTVPQQKQTDVLSTRLRELRVAGGVRTRVSADLVRREQRGQ